MAANTILDNDTDLESFTLIWLDASINEPENEETQDELCQLTDQFRTFINTEECETYIHSLSIDDHVILIASGRLGREIVPRIHQIEQIYSIYIYCFDKEANKRWAKDYSKIKEVLTAKNELIEQIRTANKAEISPINDELLYLNNLNDQFIHSQILINYLLKLKLNSPNHTQFFTLCKTECENAFQLKNLEEFEKNFSSKNILWWLTKDKFLSKLLSKTFHTRTSDLIYASRFIIRQIYQQLELNQCSTSIHVYHSHFLTNEEFEQLKNSIGKFISINTFFLTTFQRHKALLAFKQSNNLQKVLFDIHADPTKIFADITSFCYSKKQSQILFMLGSIFRISNFYQENNIWICQMNLSNENNPDLKTIFEQIKNEDEDSEVYLLSFGNVLARIGQYDDAERYYQRLLTELPSDHENTHICYRNLGNVAYLKKDYDKSLEYHLKSLELQKTLLTSDQSSIADSYNCLGIVYFNKNDYQQAIHSYENGLNIIKRALDKDPRKEAVFLTNLGLVYRTETNYVKALDYYVEALKIEEKYLPEDHSDLGQIYHNIGALYWCRGLYDKARDYYSLSLENKEKSLRFNHPSIAMTLENMGLIHENKNDFQKAFDYYRKAAEIYQQTLAANHSDVIQINDSILRVSSRLK